MKRQVVLGGVFLIVVGIGTALNVAHHRSLGLSLFAAFMGTCFMVLMSWLAWFDGYQQRLCHRLWIAWGLVEALWSLASGHPIFGVIFVGVAILWALPQRRLSA